MGPLHACPCHAQQGARPTVLVQQPGNLVPQLTISLQPLQIFFATEYLGIATEYLSVTCKVFIAANEHLGIATEYLGVTS